MAGSQDPNENPVAINVVPMVDVIFCLCVFFMCSFKFKQIEGKFDSWLPKDKGLDKAESLPSLPEEIRVALYFDPKTDVMTRALGSRRVKDDAELEHLIKSANDEYVNAHKDIPVTIDADPRLPWKEVISVINMCKHVDVQKIEFAFGSTDFGKTK